MFQKRKGGLSGVGCQAVGGQDSAPTTSGFDSSGTPCSDLPGVGSPYSSDAARHHLPASASLITRFTAGGVLDLTRDGAHLAWQGGGVGAPHLPTTKARGNAE